MEWQEILFTALGIIVTTIVSCGLERLIIFLNAKIKNTKALTFLTDAINIVANAVKATYQTYVKALKDKNAFNEAAQKEALTMALNLAKSQMSEELKEFITANFGDLTIWITSEIEANLYDLKKRND